MRDKFGSANLQPLRLASGLVLFAFAFSHFANHASGLISLDAANTFQDWRISITRSALVRVILPIAAVLHIALGLYKLGSRRTLRMPTWEWVQIATGILVPVLLIPHVVAITYFTTKTDYFYSYTSVAFALWPGQAILQSVLLLMVWMHGCIGLHFWLRTKKWYGHFRLALVGAAVALPVLALTGFLSVAREAHALFADPAALAKARIDLSWPTPDIVDAMHKVRDLAWAIYAVVIATVVAILAVRGVKLRAAPTVAVSYSGGPTVKSAIGSSILEISRMNRVPHTSICGGRARCSTCRVRVDHGALGLAHPEPAEQATLSRIGAPPNVRLACQVRPKTAITVTRLVTPEAGHGVRRVPDALDASGIEKQLAVLFLDVRGFTQISEHRLPFDVVFLLNQFFATVGAAIRNQNGWIDKYMGDGLMAVFGSDTGLDAGCRQAIEAARAIDLALDDLNVRLRAELADGLKIGIGIHAGPVVLGQIGDIGSTALTVIGRTVNEASRFEALTKEKGCQLIMSRIVAEKAGLPISPRDFEAVEIRGTSSPIEILTVIAARNLPQPARPTAKQEAMA